MPKVETYSSPQVNPQALPGVTQNIRATPDAFGAAVGQGLARAGADVAAIGLDMKRKDDAAAVKGAEIEFEQAVDEITYTGQDAYYRRQGERGYATYEETVKQIEDRRRQIGQRLTPDQRRQYELTSTAYAGRERRSMNNHAFKSRQQYLNGQDEAIVGQTIVSGSLRPDEADVSELRIVNAATNLADRNGWSPERRDAYINAQTTKLHTNTIDHMLSTNLSAAEKLEQAEAYFDKYKDNIDSSLHDEIKERIAGETDTARYQELTDRYALQFETEKEGVAYIRENYEGKDEDALIRRFRARKAEERAVKTTRTNDAYREAVQTVWNGGINQIPKEIRDHLIREDKWQHIEQEQIEMMSGFAQSDDGVWLMNELYSKPLSEQYSMDEQLIKSKMKIETYNAWADAKRKNQQYGPSQSENDLIKARLATFGILTGQLGTTETDKKHRENVTAFYDAYEDAKAQFTEDKGRAPGDFEKLDLINQVTAKWDLLKYDSLFFGMDRFETAPAFLAASPENLSLVSESLDIPQTELVASIALLEQRGQDINADNIETVGRNANRLGIPVSDYIMVVSMLVDRGVQVTDDNIQMLYEAGQQP